ncbi:MAG TPA: hypothetical protein DIV86_06285, partial [Alphaproteobacteria bacterium]|nr:hypothetical protein [Alphaproteobacteria bacterium]
MIFGSILNNLRNLLPSSEGYFGRIYSILNKIVLVTLALAAIAWYKFDYIASLLINNHDIKIAVEKILFESTGKKAVVEGDVVFITTPEPEIVVKKINIQNPVGAFKESYAQIDTLKTNPDLLSLVFGNISFDRIYLENVILNNQENSSSVNEGSGFDLKNNFYIVSDKNVKIKNIEINNYKKSLKSDSYINRKIFFTDLEYNNHLENYEGQILKGSVYSPATNENYIFLLDFKNGIFSETPISGRVYSNDVELTLTGKSNLNNNSYNISVSGKINNFTRKLTQTIGLSDKISAAIKEGEQATLNLNAEYSNSKLKLSGFKVVSDYIDFNLNSETIFSSRIDTKLNINIPKFNYSNTFKDSGEISNIKRITKIEKDFQQRLNNFFLFSLGDDIDFEVLVNIDSIQYSDESLGKMNLTSKYLNQRFSLDKFIVILPGGAGVSSAALIDVEPDKKAMNGSLVFKLTGKKFDGLL